MMQTRPVKSIQSDRRSDGNVRSTSGRVPPLDGTLTTPPPFHLFDVWGSAPHPPGVTYLPWLPGNSLQPLARASEVHISGPTYTRFLYTYSLQDLFQKIFLMYFYIYEDFFFNPFFVENAYLRFYMNFGEVNE